MTFIWTQSMEGLNFLFSEYEARCLHNCMSRSLQPNLYERLQQTYSIEKINFPQECRDQKLCPLAFKISPWYNSIQIYVSNSGKKKRKLELWYGKWTTSMAEE